MIPTGPPRTSSGDQLPWKRSVAAAISLFVVLACKHPSRCTVVAANYDQSCAADSDCAAVTELYQCGGCACASGAINKRDLAKYQSDLAGAASSAGACECPCEGIAPRCCGGVCSNSCGCPLDAGAESDASADSDANTCVTEAGVRGVPCPQTLSSFCADAGSVADSWSCGSNWQTVLAHPPCQGAGGELIVGTSCGSLESIAVAAVDSGTTVLYDTATGTLFAIVANSNGDITCIAGPPCFTVPTCVTYQEIPCPADGGVDGAGDAAVAEAGGD